ncbi:MAG: saccharopine dehydrogenase C-terminal domain-containing protein [Acutalibacteraceae bacterium]
MPIQFLKALLPDPPRSAADEENEHRLHFHRRQDGRKIASTSTTSATTKLLPRVWLAAFYTTGVPAMIGAALVVSGVWKAGRVHHRSSTDPFMDALSRFGLPWVVEKNPQLVD